VESTQVIGSVGDIPPHVEEQLIHYVSQLVQCMFGITVTDLRRLEFQVAELNSFPHRFNRAKQIAGKKCYYGFMKRHPQLSLRQPEATSMARAAGFNKQRVNEFSEQVEKIMDDNNLDTPRNWANNSSKI
jgi:hypothetical protein